MIEAISLESDSSHNLADNVDPTVENEGDSGSFEMISSSSSSTSTSSLEAPPSTSTNPVRISIVQDKIIRDVYQSGIDKMLQKIGHRAASVNSDGESEAELEKQKSLDEQLKLKNRLVFKNLDLTNLKPTLTKTSDVIDLGVDFRKISKRIGDFHRPGTLTKTSDTIDLSVNFSRQSNQIENLKRRFLANKSGTSALTDHNDIRLSDSMAWESKKDDNPAKKLLEFNNKIKMEIVEERLKVWNRRQNDLKKVKDDEEEARQTDDQMIVDEPDALLDDDKEMTDSDSSSSEEVDENDIVDDNYGMDEVREEKSNFVDDEADESDKNIDSDNEIIEEEDEILGNNNFVVDDEIEDDDEPSDNPEDADDENDDVEVIVKKKSSQKTRHKGFRRLLTKFSDDSDTEDPQKVRLSTELQQTPTKTLKSTLDLSVISPVFNLSMLQEQSQNSQLSEIQPVVPVPTFVPKLPFDDTDTAVSTNYFDFKGENSKKYPEFTTQENELLAICSEPFLNLESVIDQETKSKFDTTDNDNDVEIDDVEQVGGGNGTISRKTKKLRIESSSDDDELSNFDNGDNSDDDEIEEEEDDDNDDVIASENELIISDNESKIIDYDSEENEIIVDKREKNDFFEKEAELSGSDWGSADEDEKGPDSMEPELGDQDVFNEKKLQRELERIHMRQVLDTDKKEVRLIQELVFEDGDLFSENARRERQFRWKNIDAIDFGNDNGIHGDDNDVDVDDYIDDDESEEQWRRSRYEKEMFLKKHKSNINVEESNTFDAVEVFKCDSSESLPVEVHTKETEVFIKPTSKHIFEPFANSNKRGSFLSRNERTLEQLAKISRSVCSSSMKQKKQFVFTSSDSNSSSMPSSAKSTLTKLDENNRTKKRKSNLPSSVYKKQKVKK